MGEVMNRGLAKLISPTSTKNVTTLPSKKSMGPATTGHVFLLIALILAGFVLSPTARALLPPPTPDGGYPGNNTAEGDGALSRVQINTTTGAGIGNTAIGFSALASNTIGGGNTATGEIALQGNTLGTGNTATGAAALASNKIGNYNTASGVDALAANLNGDYNTATGLTALVSNTGGRGNTATGTAALRINTTGNFNTASGFQALEGNSTGNFNTASGFEALLSNANGSNNTANGNGALFSNNTGNNNTGTGVFALKQNTTGDSNTATGFNALLANTAGHGNMATGTGALNHNTTGNNNTAVGALAGQNLTTGSDNIDIGNPGSAGEGNKIRIGTVGKQTATFIAGIHGVTVASGVGVVVASNGQLGTVTSSARFKEAIKPMDKASEAILPLQPVTFRYKHDLDPDGIPQFVDRRGSSEGEPRSNRARCRGKSEQRPLRSGERDAT